MDAIITFVKANFEWIVFGLGVLGVIVSMLSLGQEMKKKRKRD